MAAGAGKNLRASRAAGLAVAVAVAVAVALVAVGCSSPAATTAPGTIRPGGDIAIAAEREPQCMDWISTCAGVDWGIYMVQANTMPRAYDYTGAGYQPSIVLAGPAEVRSGPQQVTYHLNPKAVWDDGRRITSHDFKYTWDQIAHGQRIFDQTGYNQIKSVDDTNPDTAVVTFSSNYPDWQMLFGGIYGILPSHILEGRDRATLMRDGYSFSAGPWKMDHWTRGTEVKLVPNPAYWGRKPILASVTFQFITDPSAERDAYRSGQVLAAYPQPEPGVEALKGLPGTLFDAVVGLSYEGLWFNVEKSPLNSKAVRQALAYATDRDGIVSQLFGSISPGIRPVNSLATPAFGATYTEPYAKFHRDLTMVDQLMAADGWAKGADGGWAKAGTQATLDLKFTVNDPRRLLIAQAIQTQWQQAGFRLSLTAQHPGTLLGQDLPQGNFAVSLYGQTTIDNDPGECVIWCSKNIPTLANGYSGQNWTRTNDPTLDKLWLDADANLDPGARAGDFGRAQAILADLVPVIPLDPLPDILVVNTDRLGVDRGSFQHNFAYGPFVNMNAWYAK